MLSYIIIIDDRAGRGACVELLWSCTLHVADVFGLVRVVRTKQERKRPGGENESVTWCHKIFSFHHAKKARKQL